MTPASKIMVVEDNVDTTNIVKMILESEGYEVIHASNGEQAKGIVNSEKPDLLILDVMMPKLDGFSFYSWLRSKEGYENVPVVLLTSVSKHIYESKHSHKEMMYADVDEYLEKPVKPEILMEIIKRLLKK
jgi:DNA-binding response OmpR family regulator